MNRILSKIGLLAVIMIFVSTLSASNDSTATKVFSFDIKEMIAPPVWRTTKKAIESAEKDGYDLIIIHMNTYGGMLDAADSIRTKILNSKIPIYVFIDKITYVFYVS